ncbi:Set3 complex subunit with deacetylase activity, meiotic-specific repressor of sporulation proteins [Mycoblastus sanguinarius]|nr:Set3 complex subunit with deacetylase activity, meiotic-specific repressor of sporulation proteins [Mycoblastus sanguinarius]
MNDDLSAASKSNDAGDNKEEPALVTQSHGIETGSDNRVSPAPSAAEKVSNVGVLGNGDPSNDKSDSEAETVVLSGKEEDQEHKRRKAIKLEEASGVEPQINGRVESQQEIGENMHEVNQEQDSRKTSLKRKRTVQEAGNGDVPDGWNSSNLSSTISSPIHEARSSKATNSESDRSRSSPPFDEVAQQLGGRLGKRRNGNNNELSHHEGSRSDRKPEPVNGRERRETRSATHYDGLAHRSESPPPRSNNRAQSTQPNHSHTHGVTKRRKAPTPLHVERRRKASEDTHPDSDGSSSIHSHHQLHKFTLLENSAMSPAKISNKKNRDRNGRTLLARACAVDVVEAEKWLKERPQDIDVPDNAGNTPLQIAALEGDVEVVQLLLDHRCDIHCKNIDKDTPLIDAVENGHLEVVKILLKAGLDPRQKNAKGQEPLELVPADDEDFEEIQAALLASKKEKETLRRPSEDHNRQHSLGTREPEMSSMAASGTSPTNSTRSPPPHGPGARRRTARSQPTDDSLLWVNATPERLREAAGKGDLTIVDHILKMRPKADTESVLAAARGGHDVVLGLLLAIAKPDPDPEPLRSPDHKPAYSTPMLAAIGRGNINVITLLLNQPGFDPTRRLFNGLTYYEIAKERQSSEWQEEYDVLKSAYDNSRQNGGRRSNNNSPRKVRLKRADSNRPTSEPSSSPHDSRKIRKPKDSIMEESVDELRHDSSFKGGAARSRSGDGEFKRQDSSAIASDHDSDLLGPPKSKAKEGKSHSDVGPLTSKRADSLKPKRRLMSGNDFKTDQNVRRRASLAADASSGHDQDRRKSGDSVSSHDQRPRRSSDASESRAKTKKASSEEPAQAKSEPGKKRPRMSVSPQASKTDFSGPTDVAKKKKRQRVDSQGSAIDQDRERSFRPGPAMVANMIASPTAIASPTISQGTAPVAFMGSNVASPVTRSPTDPHVQSALISPVNSIDQNLQQRTDREFMQVHKRVEEETLRQERLDQERELQAFHEEDERLARIEGEKRQQAEAEEEKKARAEKDEIESKARVAREQEGSRLQIQRQNEEIARQLQIEREEEEARLTKKKREEEMQKRRLEQEKLRKEEQERRRREAEERESLRRMRMQEEEERQRRASLPNGLRRAAELNTEDARDAKEVTKWLPLRTVTTHELDPTCDPQMVEERWIANIQAAPILAIKDLELSQCKCHIPILFLDWLAVHMQLSNKLSDTAWTRLPATINHQGSLWRQLRNPMSQAVPPSLLTPTEVFNLDDETRPKFFSLKHIFWIKLSEFMDIVPRHQHLNGVKFSTRAMVLHEFPFGRGGTVERPGVAEEQVKQEAVSPLMNGDLTNGYL